MQNAIRYDWTVEEIEELFALPFNDLLFAAQTVHREFHAPNEVQRSTLLSIRTGGCSEDCAYCPQSARFNTGIEAERLMPLDDVLREAEAAKASGATRYCMGAAWRRPSDRQLERVIEMIEGVRAMGMETCVTLGMLTSAQAERLAEAGLDYYNHNIDTSEEYYPEVITTRKFGDRIETLENVRDAGMKVCCGGIIGMGESRRDRASMLHTLATLSEHPESVPINRLVAVPGTPLGDTPEVDPFEFVRTIAVARIVLPASVVRLSAGRETMSDELHALCFAAGANSIFCGPRLLTTPNPQATRDDDIFARLGLRAMQAPSAPKDRAVEHAGFVGADGSIGVSSSAPAE